MKLKLLAAGICLGMLAANAQADYNVDLGLSYITGSGTDKFSSNVIENEKYDEDVSGSGMRARLYFRSVGTGSYPYREAGFLSRQSNVQVSRVRSKTEYSFDGDTLGYVRPTSTTFTGQLIVPDSYLILMAGIGKTKYIGDLTNKDRTLGVGVYLDPRSAFVLTYTVTKYDKDFYGSDQDNGKNTTLLFHSVKPAGSRSHLAFDFDLGQKSEEAGRDDTFIGGGLTWYPTQKLGVGAELEYTTGSDHDIDYRSYFFSPQVTFDFNENVGVHAKVSSISDTTKYDDGFNNLKEKETVTLVSAGINVRF